MIKVKEILIVEGKHDRVKLASFTEATIIETNGFRIFNDKNKQKMIIKLASKVGVIIITDSDSAGFVIRSFLKSILPKDVIIKNAYIPQIKGKEKRKDSVSKEGLLGVEGLSEEVIKKALADLITVDNQSGTKITKVDFFRDGLTGGENSAQKRGQLIDKLKLPSYITTNALLEYINIAVGQEKYQELINELKV